MVLSMQYQSISEVKIVDHIKQANNGQVFQVSVWMTNMPGKIITAILTVIKSRDFLPCFS